MELAAIRKRDSGLPSSKHSISLHISRAMKQQLLEKLVRCDNRHTQDGQFLQKFIPKVNVLTPGLQVLLIKR